MTAPWQNRILGSGAEPPDQLLASPLNFRIHPKAQQDALAGVLDQVGWVQDVIVNQRTQHILDGHLRVALALRRGEPFVPVKYVDLDEAEELLILATLDPLAAMAGTDAAKLDELLREVSTGDAAVQQLLDDLATSAGIVPGIAEGGGGDEFDTTTDDGPTRCQLGDLWVIGGKHKLLCGDSTDAATVARLMDGERAQGVFTSPPYAEQRKEQYGGTSADQYVAWWADVQAQVLRVLASDGSFFVNIKEHSQDVARSIYVHELVIAMVRKWAWVYIDEFCWERTGIPGDPVKMGKFKNQWEPVFWFATKKRPKFYPRRVLHSSDSAFLDDNYRPTAGKLQGTGQAVVGNDRRMGQGEAYPGNRIRATDSEALGHPAAFPVSLPSFFVQVFSDDNDLWFDPFLGSGTTLISAHRTNRRCYGLEIEPKYADVILRRAEAEGLTCERDEP